RSVARPRPGACEVRLIVRPTPGLEPAVLLDQLELLLGRQEDAILHGQLVERAGLRALHAGAVVAPDVEAERVVAGTHVVDGLDDPADLVVAVLLVAGIDLHLAGVELLLVGRQPVPGGEGRVAGREFGAGRDHAEFLLPGERLLAELVPALVELALV